MVEMNVMIDTIEKAKAFCNLCSKCVDDVFVYSEKYIVSGKSIMGLFSLNLSEPLRVEFCGNVSDGVIDEVKKFVVGE